jgi:hypothetical protein
MKINEVTETANYQSEPLLSDLSLKKILGIIKTRGLDSDKRSASIKNKIINKWQTGQRSMKHIEPELTRLGIKWKDVLN